MAQGFVYVLVNPAFPDRVKIGKTTRDPGDRAKELSATTGVPAPFIVAYYAVFSDCDRAEAYVHALLEARGVDRAPGREFFALSPRDAITIVMEAEAALEPRATPFDGEAVSAEPSDTAQALWEQLSREADEYRYGLGDVIEDQERAITLYKQAVRVGASDEAVFAALAELHAERGDEEEGIRWLMRGAESGVVGCWAELALIYMGENTWFGALGEATDIASLGARIVPNAENARKAWRRFFGSVDPVASDQSDAGGDRLYAMLRRYIELIRARPEPSDREAIRQFGGRFAEFLSAIPIQSEREAKLAQLRALIACVP